MRIPTGQVPSEACVVFASDNYGAQAVLSSSLHQIWAITYGSTLGAGLRYTPSDVFETFPRPDATDDVTELGRALDSERRAIMIHRGLGLTKLYNLVNDPTVTAGADRDVDRMRELHVELDRAVLDAYGWSDISTDHGFCTFRKMQRWTVSTTARVELLDRLLEENHRRARTESTVASRGDGAGSAVADDEDGLPFR